MKRVKCLSFISLLTWQLRQREIKLENLLACLDELKQS